MSETSCPPCRRRSLVLRLPGNRLPEATTRYVAELLPHGSYRELPEMDDMGQLFAAQQREMEEFMFGATRELRRDRALVTVLFTDIVNSTEQAALLGDARWRELLVTHEQMLRREVEAAGGRVVKLIGDGSLCTFAGPAKAIRCAERLRAAAGEGEFAIRAGLHTGECELIDGDVAGIAVHIAARVSAQAGPGEVLVSRTVRDLVTGSGIALQPRGAHELKGVPGSWELFAGEPTRRRCRRPIRPANCARPTASCCSPRVVPRASYGPPAESVPAATAARPRARANTKAGHS